MKPCLKSRTCHCRPAIAHRWGADLRERRRLKEEIAEQKAWIDAEYERSLRYKAYLELCHNVVMCRTKHGKVGVEYPALRQRLSNWESTYGTLTVPEWTGIYRCLFTHTLDHL